MNKKIISLLVAATMLFSSLPTVFAANGELVTSVKNVNGTITVEGIGEKNEAVDIFLLNPGKTVADLNAADTDAEFNAVVNYTDVVYTGSDKLFKHTFELNDTIAGEGHVLYVKTKDNSYTITLKEINVYVSKTGNDTTGNGTEAAPFATIEKAKAYAATQSKANPKNIIIDEGEYTFTSGLKFTAADSGTAEAPVTYKAKDGAKVVITGAKKLDVTNTSIFKPVTDADILAQLPDAVEDKVVEIDLAAAGLSDVANFIGAHKPGNRMEVMGVYLNGDKQQISQWPNKKSDYKMLEPAQTPSELTVSLEGVDATKAAEWAKADNFYFDGVFRHAWYNESVPVASISGNKFTFAKKPKSGVLCYKYTNDWGEEITLPDPPKTDTRIIVKNLLEEIDVPGEWFINKEATKMYYYPPYTLTESDTFEIAALKEELVFLKDCDYITFDGIEFTKNATIGENVYHAAISMDKDSEGLTVKNCTIKDVGGIGIFAMGTKVNITSNTIQNISEDGIRVWNDNSVKTLNDPKINISNNSISNVGMNITSSAMCGVTIWGAYGTVVKNNTVRNVPTTGIIDNGGPSNLLLNNEIYNVCEESLDAGAVYKGRSYVGYGFKVKNNYIHTVGPNVDRTANFITGIYLDDLYSGGIVEGNIIDVADEYETYGIVNCAGVDNTIQDNVVVNAIRANIGVTTRSNINGLTPEKLAEEKALADPATGKYHRQFYYYTNAAFATFLQATDYEAKKVPTLSQNPTEEELAAYNKAVAEREEYRRFAVMNIGEEGGPKWLPQYVDAYPEVMANYEKLVNGIYSKSDIVRNNITGGPEPRDGHVNTPAALDANVTGNTVTTDVEGTISKALANITDGVGASADVLAKTEKDFNLVYPTNEAAIKTDKTFIKWEESDFADMYEYKVYTNANLTGEPVYTDVVEENYAELTGLANDTTYYWTVTAINESRVIDETTHRATQVYSFKKSTYEFNATYDESAGRIRVDGVNNGDAKTVMMIAAVKVGTEMKAATMLTPNLDFVTGYDDASYLSVTPQMQTALATSGATLELYIWEENMTSLTGKIILK